jgi:hypothetical protein
MNIFYEIEKLIWDYMVEVYDETPDKVLKEFIDQTSDGVFMRPLSFENPYVVTYLETHWLKVLIYIKNELSEHTTATEVTQSMLCDIYPGVYYNFLCRVRYEKDYKVRNGTGINKILEGKYLKNIQPTITNIIHQSPLTKQLLLDRLGEGLKRRRIQKTYHNSNVYKTHRNKQYKQHHAQITKKIASITKKIEEANKRNHVLEFKRFQLVRNAKRITNNYHNFVNPNIHKWRAYGAPNGNYIKIKGKWVPRNANTLKMNHKSPESYSMKLY